MASKELELIGKVELRIALAESDQQLEQTLGLFLPPLLLKLSSSHADVRQAVFKIIQNIFPRVTAARNLQLPVIALLNQVQVPNVPAGTDLYQVRLYSLLFLSKGVERLQQPAKVDLVPRLINRISQFPTPVAARLFSLLIKLLDDWAPPDSNDHERVRKSYGFIEHPDDEAYIASKFTKFFMLQPNGTAAPAPMPGLSMDDVAFFTKDAGVTYNSRQDIDKRKLKILDFLKVGFTDRLLSLPLLVATADSSSAVSDRVETWFKKLSLNLDELDFIKNLSKMFVGDDKTPQVKSTLQEKILVLLVKSPVALSESEVEEISSIGLLSDYSKLKQLTVTFIRGVTKLGKVTLSYSTKTSIQLKESIVANGWPQMDTSKVGNYRTAMGLRQLQYEALGDILRNSPEIWNANLDFIRFLFSSLEEETAELRPVIQEALSRLTVHLPELANETKHELKAFLKGYLINTNHSPNILSCKYIAIKFVNCAFPFEDADARFLCIIGKAKQNNTETIEEAGKGLHPFYFNLLTSSNKLDFQSSKEFLGSETLVKFPSFEDMVSTIGVEFARFPNDSTAWEQFGEAIQFVLYLLVMQSIEGKSTVVVPDEDWHSRIEKALEVDEKVRQMVINQIQILAYKDVPMAEDEIVHSSFNSYLGMIFDGIFRLHSTDSSIPSNYKYAAVLRLLLSMSPTSVLEEIAQLVPKVYTLINEGTLNKPETKDLCEVFGIIASHPIISSEYLNGLLRNFAKEFDKLNFKEARVLALSFLISRLVLRDRNDELDGAVISAFVQFLLVSMKDPRNYTVSLQAVTELAIFGTLGPNYIAYDTVTEDVQKIYDIIQPKAKSCNESSVIALSKLALAIPSTYKIGDDLKLSDTEQLVVDTNISKQIDFTFASGEALVILAGGWTSNILQQTLDIQGATIKWLPEKTDRLPIVLDYVLTSCAQTKPSLRKAGCIWLLSIVQYLGHLPLIKEKSQEIHLAFMKFLVDRDDLIQESASRGLTIIYELGDNDLKEVMVKSLLRNFTDSKESNSLKAGTVDLETQLFDKDVLKTHDGSVSTYRDVLNLAADVGDPSLVYKFMSLAKSNALWSSRKGMAFGLGSILSKTSLDDLFSKNQSLSSRLIPRLYRYRFDPNISVAKSMGDIWNILVKDLAKTTRDNFEVILQEILKSMGSKEWRVRQAGVSALSDLLQTQPLDQYDRHLEEIWKMTFRAMDDIKESVRKEGTSLAKSLARNLIRAADESTGTMKTDKASAVMNDLIPFLLGSKGLLSDAEDVRDFALETILKLCKLGGKSVRQHVPNLISTLIELMSTLEPEIVNYLVLNADKYNLDSNEVDAKRMQNLGASPIMDAIERTLGLVDSETMPIVIQRLQKSIKKSVGLPSKVCGAKVVVSLITKHYAETKPYGDKLLTICINQLKDRNQTVSSSYAAAAGYCCKIASTQSVVEYGSYLKNLYFESEEEEQRVVVGMASENVSRYSGSDKFETVAGEFLPLAFIGTHDILELVKSSFDREWTESSSGNNAIKLYFDEICELCKVNGLSSNYNVRRVIARSLDTMWTSIDVDSERQTQEFFSILLDLSKGKSWEGKDLILSTLVGFSVKKAQFLNTNPAILKQVVKTVQTEAKRRNQSYQLKAILCLGEFVRGFPTEAEAIETYIEIMENVLADDYLEGLDIELEIDEGKTSTNKDVKLEEFYLNYVGNTFKAISTSNLNNDLLKLAFESMKSFRNREITTSWRTCTSFNEYFAILLKDLLNHNLNLESGQLNLISDAFLYLTSFNEQYRLEKALVLFARNTRLLIELFSKNDLLEKVAFVSKYINQLKQQNNSTVSINELELATKQL